MTTYLSIRTLFIGSDGGLFSETSRFE